MAAVAIVVVAVVVSWAGPAGATFDANDVGCKGKATIIPKGGAPFVVDAAQATVTLPKEAGPVDYAGSVSTVTHDHVGEVRLDVGPYGLKIFGWKSKNGSNESAKSGVHAYPSLSRVPPGIYRITGFHRGNEGGCSGHMDVIVAGSPLSSPVGIGSAAGTVLSAVGVIAAGRKRAGRSA